MKVTMGNLKKHLNTILIASPYLTLLIAVSFFLYKNHLSQQGSPVIASSQVREKIFTQEELKEYDGTNPAKPIYIGLDGFIYDVSKGSEFYAPGKPYHSLTGKDSSQELRQFGGNIIKKKYPIVGKL